MAIKGPKDKWAQLSSDNRVTLGDIEHVTLGAIGCDNQSEAVLLVEDAESLHDVPAVADGDGFNLDLDHATERQAISVLTEVLLPRPVAWVVSDNGPSGATDASEPGKSSSVSMQSDRWNLAPFSYFNGVSSDPPLIMLSIGLGMDPRGFKDTNNNIEQRHHFVVHIPTLDDVRAVVQSSAPLDPRVSESSQIGLGLVPWAEWPVPRLDLERIALGCTLEDSMGLGRGQQRLILARVHRVRIPKDLLTTDRQAALSVGSPQPRLDVIGYSPLAALGRGYFGYLGGYVYEPRTHSG